MSHSQDYISKKVDIALSDLTSGGILLPEQSSSFIQVMLDQPTILKSCRFQPMNGPSMNLNKVAFNNRILTAAVQSGGALDAGGNSRYVTAANRAKPQLSQVQLNTKEVVAEIRLPYEVLEDNVEGAAFGATILSMIAKAAARDIEELIILGDTASADPYLALVDGILKQATSGVVDNAGASISTGLFGKLHKSIPTRFQGNVDEFNWFLHQSLETDYRMKVASQVSTESSWVLGASNLGPMGNMIQKTAKMPTQNIVFTHPKNIVVGFHREVRIEQEKAIRSREVVVVLSARLDVKIEEISAVSVAKNVASLP